MSSVQAPVEPNDHLAGLNDAQREAVLHTEGPLLVIAGAGSRKTRVLTHRVAHLIRACGVKPNEILAITFSDQTVAEVYELYQRRLFNSNAVDFDDLLMLTVEVLERFPEARERWQQAFRYILVDEYQDTNHAQYRLLQLLASEHRNVFAVGDPDQSVYSFRGADISNILDFERDFPGAATIALEQNYRPTQNILDAATGA